LELFFNPVKISLQMYQTQKKKKIVKPVLIGGQTRPV